MAFLRAAGALSTNVLLALAGPLLTEHAALVTWQPRGAASGLLVEDFNGFLAAACGRCEMVMGRCYALVRGWHFDHPGG